MKKVKIYQNDWLMFHPYPKPTSVDGYYVKLANKVLDVFKSAEFGFDLPEEDVKEIACAITAYFEDVISGIGMFKAFTRKHRELYGTPLPFYTVDENEYYEDEINEVDVRFLLWHYTQQTHGRYNHSVLNPDNPGINIVALAVLMLFEKEYESAPENEQFKAYYLPEYRYNEYYGLRYAMQWLQWNSYLFYHQNRDLREKEEAIEKDLTNENANAEIYDLQDSFVHNHPSPLLAIYTNEWLSEILTPAHPDYELVKSIGRKKKGVYLCTGEEQNNFCFRNLETQEEIVATKDSIAENAPLKANQTLADTGFIRFNNEWWMTGSMATFPYSEEVEQEFSKSNDIPDVIYQNILKKSENKHIHFFGNKSELHQFFYKVLETENHPENKAFDNVRNLLVFITPHGISIYPDICDYIKDEQNPYYDEKMAKAEAFSLYANMYDHPVELVYTLHNQYLLPDAQLKSLVGEERGKELIQGNAGFIMRYFYGEKYREALEKGTIQ
ncbi:DUF3843 family protein [Parabacteroides sp. FAFU027]|uniref:DUF3843 family protein n=1 Tax=Parabacteroides sp. FAFU027 TaxID=2922715 RepID=UPI001FB013B5|nr:DUF3843 family protein [Parabacteroides sp. FAFU027]